MRSGGWGIEHSQSISIRIILCKFIQVVVHIILESFLLLNSNPHMDVP